MRLFLALLFGSVILGSGVALAEEDHPKPSIETGARVYAERCVLCHGSQAMGEGVLPLKLKDYPKTNMRSSIKAKTAEEIQNVVIYGGTLDNISKYMPPFGRELNWTELESVSSFIFFLREKPKEAIAMINSAIDDSESTAYDGAEIYATRCVLCHGKYGEGDGRMSKILKSPPPANLTRSYLPDDYLTQIIREGGEAMGRSKHMPPWKDQLNDQEISHVIDYLKTIRKPL